MILASRRVLLLPVLAASAAVAALAGAAIAGRPPAACSLLKPTEIASALRAKAGACAEGDLGPQRGATWRTPNGEEALVQVSATGQNAAQQYHAYTALAKGVRLAGIGDKAFYDTSHGTLYFLKHNVYVQISLPRKTSVAAATKLGRLVAGRLK